MLLHSIFLLKFAIYLPKKYHEDNEKKEVYFMNIGFIGVGHMAQAILKGLIKEHPDLTDTIRLASLHHEHCQEVADTFGVQAVATNQDLVADSDIIILAVKPTVASSVLNEIGEQLIDDSKVLISIAAGLTLDTLHTLTKTEAPLALIRTMPNLASAVGCGATAICTNEHVTAKQLETAEMIFRSIGEIYPLTEKEFDIFSAIAGSSPAFMFLFIDALAHAGVKYGLSKKEATQIAAQSMLGSAQLLLQSNQHPWELIDQVCSPGGTTIEGVLSLEKNAFSGVIAECIDATFLKNKKLEKNID